MTLLFLPPYAPELMPVERLRLWMKDHHLCNRVFKDEAQIDASCRDSWNTLTTERIRSVCRTAWLGACQ